MRPMVLLAVLTCFGCQPGVVRDPIIRDAGRPLDVGLDAAPPDSGTDDAGTALDPWELGPPLGARRHQNGDVEVRVRAPHATRVEVAFFGAALGETERLRLPLERDGDRFDLRVSATALAGAGIGSTVLYGYRVFGPNWPYDGSWEPGSEAGRLADVDDDGNRMNPNKLVLDPYALEMSHDPINAEHTDYGFFRTDVDNRARDSGPYAPKGVVVDLRRRPPHIGQLRCRARRLHARRPLSLRREEQRAALALWPFRWRFEQRPRL